MIMLKYQYEQLQKDFSKKEIEHNCINCGASLPHYNGEVKCKYCNSVLIVNREEFKKNDETFFNNFPKSLKPKTYSYSLESSLRYELVLRKGEYTGEVCDMFLKKWGRNNIGNVFNPIYSKYREQARKGVLIVELTERYLKTIDKKFGVDFICNEFNMTPEKILETVRDYYLEFTIGRKKE